jgi:flagellin-like hook-associated protein FlgL
VNTDNEGIKDFQLNFFDDRDILINSFSTLSALSGQDAPQEFLFHTVKNVSRVDLVVLNCHPQTYNRIEIREVSFYGAKQGSMEQPGVSLINLPWSDLHASIMQVAQARAQNGAEQMRLEMAGDLNSTNILNMESAVSRIMDVDIAEESATLARSRVLQQAGTAMLAQANQSSQSILKLIEMN